jgi:hypothetical protein
VALSKALRIGKARQRCLGISARRRSTSARQPRAGRAQARPVHQPGFVSYCFVISPVPETFVVTVVGLPR